MWAAQTRARNDCRDDRALVCRTGNFTISKPLEFVLQFESALLENISATIFSNSSRVIWQRLSFKLFQLFIANELSQSEDFLAEQFLAHFCFFNRETSAD